MTAEDQVTIVMAIILLLLYVTASLAADISQWGWGEESSTPEELDPISSCEERDPDIPSPSDDTTNEDRDPPPPYHELM